MRALFTSALPFRFLAVDQSQRLSAFPIGFRLAVASYEDESWGFETPASAFTPSLVGHRGEQARDCTFVAKFFPSRTKGRLASGNSCTRASLPKEAVPHCDGAPGLSNLSGSPTLRSVFVEVNVVPKRAQYFCRPRIQRRPEYVGHISDHYEARKPPKPWLESKMKFPFGDRSILALAER